MIREIKGHHVLFALIAFFGVVILVNIIFVAQAFRTFSGEDEPRSYIQGIHYNDVLERREAQAALGWSADSTVTRSGVRLAIADADGLPVTGLIMDAYLRHPTDSGLDIMLDLQTSGAGLYLAEADIPAGRWTLLVSTPEGPPFEMEQEIWLQ
ncbi:MAG: ferredoxin [Hyphobacterium sp.]|nr:MAG: ferredoxin [Hyphobacterium sp.]